MTSVLALDLSKSRTGWALWDGKSDKARHGSQPLGSSLTDMGTVFARVHGLMNDVYAISPYDSVVMEEPLNPAVMNKINSFEVPFLLYGLASHALSFCAAKGIRNPTMVHQATWRRHFIGTMKRGTGKTDLKAMTMARCRQMGLKPKNDDEGDALAILDYAISLDGIIPPWRAENILTSPFA